METAVLRDSERSTTLSLPGISESHGRRSVKGSNYPLCRSHSERISGESSFGNSKQLREHHVDGSSSLSGSIVLDTEQNVLSHIGEDPWEERFGWRTEVPRIREIRVSKDEHGAPAGRRLICVSERKYPYKLTPPPRPVPSPGTSKNMDILEVVSRTTEPLADDEEDRFRYHAERLTAAVVTQIVHHRLCWKRG